MEPFNQDSIQNNEKLTDRPVSTDEQRGNNQGHDIGLSGIGTGQQADGTENEEKSHIDCVVGFRPSDIDETVDDPKPQTTTEVHAKQIALKKLRSGQTYDAAEDNVEDHTVDSAMNDEAYMKALNKARQKFVFFWKSHDIYSQWNTKWPFYVDGQKFSCAEQFMMYKKAVLFGDEEIAKEILHCKDPRRIKTLGREVRNFDEEKWADNCLQIVKEGNMAKFSQNQAFLAEMLFTYPKVLVEASPYDNIWGIGLEESSPDAWDYSTWAGSNYLGYVLTEVRDDIMVQRGMIDEKDRVSYIDWLLGYSQAQRTNTCTEGLHHKHEEYLLFSGGIYSQWYKSHFEVDKEHFSCAEQYMMFKKADLFKDNDIAKKILQCDNPKKMKQLGRQVKGFSEKKWNQHCLHIVKEGNLAKFSQNEKLSHMIVTTYPKIFVESNPFDTIWGIGLKEDDPDAQNKRLWRGKNCLGYILTEVRDELLCRWGLLKEEKKAKYLDKLLEDWSKPVDKIPETDRHGKKYDNRHSGRKENKHDSMQAKKFNTLDDKRQENRHDNRHDNKQANIQGNRHDSRYENMQDNRHVNRNQNKQDSRYDNRHDNRQVNIQGNRHDSRYENMQDNRHVNRNQNKQDSRYDNRHDNRQANIQGNRHDIRYENMQDNWNGNRNQNKEGDRYNDSNKGSGKNTALQLKHDGNTERQLNEYSGNDDFPCTGKNHLKEDGSKQMFTQDHGTQKHEGGRYTVKQDWAEEENDPSATLDDGSKTQGKKINPKKIHTEASESSLEFLAQTTDKVDSKKGEEKGCKTSPVIQKEGKSKQFTGQEKTKPGNNQVEHMSRSQIKKLQRTREEQKQDGQKGQTGEGNGQESQYSSGLSRRQRRNQKKKQK